MSTVTSSVFFRQVDTRNYNVGGDSRLDNVLGRAHYIKQNYKK